MAAAAAADEGDVFGVGVVIALSSSPSFSPQKKRNQKDHQKLMTSNGGDADADDVGSVGVSKKTKKRKQDNQVESKSNNNNNARFVEKFEATAASASCSFPMKRAWRLVRGEAGNADIRTTNEAVFLINKASEMFLQRFAQEAYSNAPRDRKRSITYHHLSSTVCNGKRYEFLSDFVPEKVKAEDALKARALAET